MSYGPPWFPPQSFAHKFLAHAGRWVGENAGPAMPPLPKPSRRKDRRFTTPCP